MIPPTSPITLVKMLCVVLVLSVMVGTAPHSLASRAQGNDALPAVMIDALDGYRWSTDEVLAAPGQRIVVTNRDAQRHTFVVDEWTWDENLPRLDPVELVVPLDAAIGTIVTFYSSVGDDRERGYEGVLIVATAEEILSSADPGLLPAGTVEDRQSIEVSDDFAFSPPALDVSPGEIIEVHNIGLIEHHFVVDEWDLNETLPAGDVVLVQVPPDAEIGLVLTFYCSVPGHTLQGMTGQLTIAPGKGAVGTVPQERAGRTSVDKDLRPFVPGPAFLGPEWDQLRVGDAATLLDSDDAFSESIFPHDGIGAVYVGPQGSRVTLIVLPVTRESLPANQVSEAISRVQSNMIVTWKKDRIATAARMDDAPPSGCDTAQRASGIVPVLTIPAGAPACELRGPGVAIFVTVEGAVGDMSGVDAADEVITMLLTRTSTGDAEGTADG